MRYLFVLLLVSGCARHYVHPEKGRAFEADYYDCQKEAAAQNQRRKEMIDRCMRLRGWEAKRDLEAK